MVIARLSWSTRTIDNAYTTCSYLVYKQFKNSDPLGCNRYVSSMLSILSSFFRKPGPGRYGLLHPQIFRLGPFLSKIWIGAVMHLSLSQIIKNDFPLIILQERDTFGACNGSHGALGLRLERSTFCVANVKHFFASQSLTKRFVEISGGTSSGLP